MGSRQHGGSTAGGVLVVLVERCVSGSSRCSSIKANPKMEVVVDLPNQTVTNTATGKSEHFEINGYKKHCLMNGLDDIDYLLTVKDKTEAYEKTAVKY